MQELNLLGLNEKIYIHETKEGLKVYMWVNENISSFYATLSVKYGSIHTKFKVGKTTYEVPSGIAHFLEHIKFNINDNLSAHELFASSNADANAFTTFNFTSYLFYSNKNKVDNLNHLLDYVFTPYFTIKDIKKEKGIILEEANMGADDNYTTFFFKSLEGIFKKSKYRELIIGSASDIKKISLKDIKLVYETFYHPKNMFLCLTGNFNPYEMAQVIDNNLAKKKFKDYKYPEIIKEKEPKKVNIDYKEYKEFVTIPKIRYTLKMPLDIYKGIDKTDLKVICNLILSINFGPTSDFLEEVKEKQLVSKLYYNVEMFDDYLLISIITESNYPQEIIKRIKKQFSNLVINEVELVRKRNASIATLILDYDDIEIVNSIIQDDLMLEGKIITNLKERLEQIDSNKLKMVASKFLIDNSSIVVFLPKEK